MKLRIAAYSVFITVAIVGCKPSKSRDQESKAESKTETSHHETIRSESDNRFQLTRPEDARVPASSIEIVESKSVEEPLHKEHASSKEVDKKAEKSAAKRAEKDFSSLAQDLSKKVHAIQLPESLKASRSPASQLGQNVAASEAHCAPLEFGGADPQVLKMSASERQELTKLFEQSKDKVLSWLNDHSKKLGALAVQTMRKKIQSIELRLAPSWEEPDLSWRGIGALSWTKKDEHAVLEIGGGFPKLLQQHPERARFEMVRLVSQAWDPCRLQSKEVSQPWSGFLQCMKISETTGCATGGYSEAGWAVSTAVAQKLSQPGCKLPAFENPSDAQCVDRFLLPLNKVAGSQARSE